MQHLGPRSVVTVIGLLSALVTVVGPFAARAGYQYFIVCRIIQGKLHKFVKVMHPKVKNCHRHVNCVNENVLVENSTN